MADRKLARKVLETEAAAILALVDRLDHRFDCAVELLRNCKGRVILTGMGKSGIICRKIAATLTSTGTPAFFLHPAEARHGDLGVIQSDDVVVALSYSGETEELVRLLETIRRLGAKLIAITGGKQSTLAQAADVSLDCSVAEEACPMNLVPTASTTAALAIGDALAMTLLVEKGFREEDFANLHPGGKLGKRLMRVESLMHSGDKCPIVHATTRMRDVIYEMSRKGLGMTCVVDGSGEPAALLGIITDGDLRRHMEGTADVLDLTAADVMTRHPVSVTRNTLAAEALNLMEQRKITSIVVADKIDGDATKRVAGVVHLHDLWRMELF
jgi:arabinose-5-phosphate isomerase